MPGAMLISPSSVEVDAPLGRRQILEIDLVGEPSGLVFLLCAEGRPPADASTTMNALAEHGYSTVAVDLSTDEDGGARTDEQSIDELGFLLDRAANAGWELDQVGLVGYGAGARAALLGAMAFDVGAAVSVSPGRTSGIRPVGRSSSRRTPWLGMFGELDPNVTSAEILSLYGRLRGYSEAFVSIVSYEAGPDFYLDSSDPVVHAAAFDSWQRTVEWLQLRVAPRLTPLALAWRERTGTNNERTTA